MGKKRPPVLAFATASRILCSRFPFKNVCPSSFKELPSYDDRHFYFEGQPDTSSSELGTAPFVLRLSNLMFGAQLVDGANAVMLHLRTRGINCSQPISSRFGRYVEMISGKDLTSDGACEEYPVRVLTFIPGVMMTGVDTNYLTPPFLYSVGHFAGKIDTALQVKLNVHAASYPTCHSDSHKNLVLATGFQSSFNRRFCQ